MTNRNWFSCRSKRLLYGLKVSLQCRIWKETRSAANRTRNFNLVCTWILCKATQHHNRCTEVRLLPQRCVTLPPPPIHPNALHIPCSPCPSYATRVVTFLSHIFFAFPFSYLFSSLLFLSRLLVLLILTFLYTACVDYFETFSVFWSVNCSCFKDWVSPHKDEVFCKKFVTSSHNFVQKAKINKPRNEHEPRNCTPILASLSCLL